MQLGAKEYRSFVGGLVTEANALTFPENASIDESNFVLNSDGSRKRRLGIDYEDLYSVHLTSQLGDEFTNHKVNTFLWENAGGIGTSKLLVVQVKDTLYFFDAAQTAPSGNYIDTITLPITGDKHVQWAVLNGWLIGATGETLPYIITYSGGSFSYTTIDVNIADLFGIEDGYDVDENPATLTDEHNYNLHNQGWNTTRITAYQSSQTTYPDNSQIWFYGKDSSDNFSPSLLVKQEFGSTAAPKGHYIIDAFNRGSSRETLLGSGTLPADSDSGRPATVASYSGRVWYSGVESVVTSGDDKSPNYSGYVFFSQIAGNKDQLGKCYAEGDPTAEWTSDVVDTDGGFIVIPEAYNIHGLYPIGESLIVFASNGVWQIFGGDKGFTATEHAVHKITSVGSTGYNTIVPVENSLLYWSDGGIYSISADKVTEDYIPQNITQRTIQSYYNAIPADSREKAVGVYDTTAKKVSWLFNTDSTSYKYNKELVLDAVLEAYYVNDIADSTPYIAGFADVASYAGNTNIDEVVSAGSIVVVDSVPVTITTEITEHVAHSVKYLTVVPQDGSGWGLTLSHYKSTTFKDWYTYNTAGVDYSSYLITGYETFGDVVGHKVVPYIHFFFNRTEEDFNADTGEPDNQSSCLVQSQWGWADSANSGRWGSQFQAYRLRRNYIRETSDYDYGFSTIVTKNKLRGNGPVVSLKIESETGKNLHLLGWAMQVGRY